MIDSVVRLLLENLTELWKPIGGIQFNVHGRETRPQLLQVSAPNEIFILLGFDIRVGEARGMINFALPASVIEAAGGNFSQGWHRTRKEQTDRDRQRLIENIGRIPVSVAVDIDSHMTAADVLQLRQGDVISLGRPLREPVDVKVLGIVEVRRPAAAPRAFLRGESRNAGAGSGAGGSGMSDQTPGIGTLLESLAAAMASAVAALSGGTTTPVSADAPDTSEWLVRLVASGDTSAEILVGLSDQDARRLAGLLMGLEGDEVADDAVSDALREISGQAIGTLSQAPETAAITLSDVTVAKATFEGTPNASYAFQLPNDFVLRIVLGASAAAATAASSDAIVAAGQPLSVPASAPVAAVALPNASMPRNLDLLLDIELPLAVRFGQTELTLNTLTRLGPGSVIDLHRSADEPVEIFVGGKMIARGEVVVVEGNYGVRVTEVLSTADRIRSLGA